MTFEYAKKELIKRKDKALREAGELVISEALENFKTESFEGKLWKARADGSSSGERTTRRNLLVKSGTLRRSLRITKITSNSITVGTDVPYAQIHNEGGTTNPKVTEKSKKFFWRKYKQTGNPKYKAMALTKKTSFKVDIPARPFLKVTDNLKMKVIAKMQEIFNKR